MLTFPFRLPVPVPFQKAITPFTCAHTPCWRSASCYYTSNCDTETGRHGAQISFFFTSSGIAKSILTLLKEENVSNMTIFVSLREEHFEILLPKLTVGDHAVLLKLWDSREQGLQRSRDVSVCNFSAYLALHTSYTSFFLHSLAPCVLSSGSEQSCQGLDNFKSEMAS